MEAALRPRAWTSLLHFSSFWMGRIYVERIHNKQSSKAIEKHQKKKGGLTRDDVGQGVIERCLGVVAVSSKGCFLLE